MLKDIFNNKSPLKHDVKLLVLVTTSRCNSRCRMCEIWKDDAAIDMSLDKISEIINSPYIRNSLEEIIVGGGEPTLVKHFPEIFSVAFREVKHLKHISFATNSIIPAASLVEQILIQRKIVKREDVNISIVLSLDGFKKTHDEIRGIKGAFDKVMENYFTLKALQSKYNFGVAFNYTVQKYNVENGDAYFVLDMAEKTLLPIRFSLVIENDFMTKNLEFSQVGYDTQNREEYIKFFSEANRRSQEGRMAYEIGMYYDQLVKQIQLNKRLVPCLFKGRKALFVNYDANVYICGRTKAGLIGSIDDLGKQGLVENASNNILKICDTCLINCAPGGKLYQLYSVLLEDGPVELAKLIYLVANKRFNRIKRLYYEYKNVVY